MQRSGRSYCHQQQSNIQLVTSRMAFRFSNQDYKSTEGNSITFHGLGHQKLTYPGSLTLSYLEFFNLVLPGVPLTLSYLEFFNLVLPGVLKLVLPGVL